MTAAMVDDGHDLRGCPTWPGECTWEVITAAVGPVRVRRWVHTCLWDDVHRGPCTCRRCGTSTPRKDTR